MQKCEKKSDAEAWNKVFYESNVNTLIQSCNECGRVTTL